MKSGSLLAAAALFVYLAPLAAQAPADPKTASEPDKIELWKCAASGGSYQVAIRAIIAVSSHEYVVDAVARVSEVNVDTTGHMSVRFYYLEPLTPSVSGFGEATANKLLEMAETAVDKTGQGETLKKVVKNYPATTHAGTIEFRLGNKADLEKIFKSAETSFRLQRAGAVKIP